MARASYLAGVARRAAPGRTTLLPPAAPWGIEPRPAAFEAVAVEASRPAEPVVVEPRRVRPVPLEPVGAAAEPVAGRRRARVGRRAAPAEAPIAATVESADTDPLQSGVAQSEPEAAPAAVDARAAPRSRPRQAARANATEISAARAAGEPRSVALPARPADAVRPTRAAVPVADASSVARGARRSERAATAATAPSVRIGTIEVVVAPPPARAPRPPAEQAPRAPSAPQPLSAGLARGYSSLLGLRQG